MNTCKFTFKLGLDCALFFVFLFSWAHPNAWSGAGLRLHFQLRHSASRLMAAEHTQHIKSDRWLSSSSQGSVLEVVFAESDPVV